MKKKIVIPVIFTLCFYATYLHMKIHVLKLLVVDNFTIQADLHIRTAYAIEEEALVPMTKLNTSFLITDWDQFDKGIGNDHPGKDWWKYKIAEAIKKNRLDLTQASPALKEYIVTLDSRKKPICELEFYQAWDSPFLKWWP
jgi:hypothetical protein